MSSLRHTTAIKPMHTMLTIAGVALVRACNWLVSGIQFTAGINSPEQDYIPCPLSRGSTETI